MTTKIQIWTRLNEGIYESLGGGETRIVREYTYGPRNLVRAYRELLRIRAANERNYGTIGCGVSGLCTTDGRSLSGFAFVDVDESHAEQVKSIELGLLTDKQHEDSWVAIDAATPDPDNAPVPGWPPYATREDVERALHERDDERYGIEHETWVVGVVRE